MKLKFLALATIVSLNWSIAQENVTFQKPSKPILDLADYQRAPSVSMDNKKEYMLLTYLNNLKIRKISDKKELQVKGIPENAKITNVSWSPSENKIAFTNTTKKGVELWIIDVPNQIARKITEDNLNANLGSPYTWHNNNELLIKVLPKNRPALIDTKKDLPTGPTVSTSDGSKSQNRTYQDLLKNKTDETNFDIITTSELYLITTSG